MPSLIFTTRKTMKQHREARDYYNLCEQAAALGIPTSLDNPASPKTVQGLRDAVAACLPEA